MTSYWPLSFNLFHFDDFFLQMWSYDISALYRYWCDGVLYDIFLCLNHMWIDFLKFNSSLYIMYKTYVPGNPFKLLWALLICCIYMALKMQVFGKCSLYVDFVYLDLLDKWITAELFSFAHQGTLGSHSSSQIKCEIWWWTSCLFMQN